MAEAIDIRELNERIERQSAFVTNLMTGMDQVIVGQKHLVESLLIGLLSDGHILQVPALFHLLCKEAYGTGYQNGCALCRPIAGCSGNP